MSELNRVIITITNVLLAMGIMIQKDELGNLLINGHVTLAYVTGILLLTAIYHLIRLTFMNEVEERLNANKELS